MSDATEPIAAEQKDQYEPRMLYTLNIEDLQPDPNQPRKYFDPSELHDLANSIKKHGVLQPVLFRVDKEGKQVLVSGERRYQASIQAKKDTIPAIYTVDNPAEIALIENLLRADLTPLEEAEGLKKLQDEAKYKNKELAAVIGKAESSISEILSLTKLPEKIKAEIRTSKVFSRRQLIEVAKGKDEKEITKKFKSLKKYNTSSVELKEKGKDGRSSADSILKRMIKGLTTQLTSLSPEVLSHEDYASVKADLTKLAELLAEKLC
jgi:ParB family transcriptional regulator, chromosome partitioning protein